jgi:hypothetical protein
LALPGKYTVKLTAGDKTLTSTLEIKMDPNVKTSAADLEKQFQLASALAGSIGEVSAAIQRGDDLLKQIAARGKDAAGNAEVAAGLTELEKKVGAVAGPAGGGGFGFFGLAVPGAEPVTLRQTSAALGGLLGIVESADAAPTKDAAAASDKWQIAGKAALSRWDSIQTKGVANVNALLEKAHLQPLKAQ